MKDYQISYESFMFSHDEQEFAHLMTINPDLEGRVPSANSASHLYPYTVTSDMEIRDGLTEALGGLGKSVQALIGLLEKNDILNVLPKVAVAEYSMILKTITEAARQGSTCVMKSQEFDESQIFSSAMPVCNILQ